jgi:hypothetical protein
MGLGCYISNLHDDKTSGPSFAGSRHSGKKPMAKDTRGRGNDQARDIGLGMSMGSTGKESSSNKSSKETKSTIKASKQDLYERWGRWQRQEENPYSGGLSRTWARHNSSALANPHPIALLDELQDEITDEIYVAASIVLTDEQLQNVFVLWNKQRKLLWLSKLKPLDWQSELIGAMCYFIFIELWGQFMLV